MAKTLKERLKETADKNTDRFGQPLTALGRKNKKKAAELLAKEKKKKK